MFDCFIICEYTAYHKAFQASWFRISVRVLVGKEVWRIT